MKKEDTIKKLYAMSEMTIETNAARRLIVELENKIKQLESICDDLVDVSKGQESQSWSDYKGKR